jgi:hypothetical protein
VNDDRLVTVSILGLPAGLHQRAQAHSDELMREFRLLTEQMRSEGPGHLPARLVTLVDSLGDRYSVFTEEQEDQLDAAIAAGESEIDVSYVLPAHAAQAAADLGTVLDEADDFCRSGQHLLTLATPPDCLAYRRWFLDEFIRQVAGEEPWAQSSYAAEIAS